MNITRIGLIGFGEAGGILAEDLRAQGLQIQVYDRLLGAPETRAEMQRKAERLDVQLAASADAAARDAQLIISAVTAGSALQVAQQLAPQLRAGQRFMDINSVAPASKRAARDAIEPCGAHYIDAAVMAPVPPQRLRTPILLGGRQAPSVATALNALGCNTRVVAGDIGAASAIKMCRSVMIKGLEALASECLSSARRYGAEDEVLASLHKSFPSMGWDGALPHYLFSRVAEHGRRRAEEMEEVARTVRDVGVEPLMSEAIVRVQRGLVDRLELMGLSYCDLQPFDWLALDARLDQRS